MNPAYFLILIHLTFTNGTLTSIKEEHQKIAEGHQTCLYLGQELESIHTSNEALIWHCVSSKDEPNGTAGTVFEPEIH